jgi:hypothetical protein
MKTDPIQHCKYKMLGLALGVASAALVGIEDAEFSAAKAQFKSSWAKIGRTLNGGDVYIKEGSKRNIKSVEFSYTTYHRGDFSYTDYIGNTTTKRLVVDCDNSSYKNDDSQSGYYVDLSWITPFTSKESIESIGYYCPEAGDPWVEFNESSGALAKIYYINARTISEDKHPRYGVVRSAIVVEGYKSSRTQSSIFMFYVACRRGLSGTRDMYAYMRPSNPSLTLTEDNPGSLGDFVRRQALAIFYAAG